MDFHLSTNLEDLFRRHEQAMRAEASVSPEREPAEQQTELAHDSEPGLLGSADQLAEATQVSEV